MSNNITKQLYENIYRALGGDPNVQFETADDVWNAVTDIYDEGYDPVDLTPLNVLVTQNGTFEYTAPDNDGYNKVTVDVNVPTSGGGGGLDFSTIGYTPEETDSMNNKLQEEFNYSQQIIDTYNNSLITGDWFDLTSFKDTVYFPKLDGYVLNSLSQLFSNNKKLKYVPPYECSDVPEEEYGYYPAATSMFENCVNLTDVPQINYSNAYWCDSMFKNTAINYVDIQINYPMSCTEMFSGCNNLAVVQHLTENFNGCSSMREMFKDCGSLFIVPSEFNTTDALTETANMFFGCYNLQNAPSIYTGSVMDFTGMFNACSQITSVSLNTTSATNMSNMFSGCNSLTNIEFINGTSNVTDMTMLFGWNTSLTDANNIIGLDTTNMTTAMMMFSHCMNLTTLPALNFGNLSDAGYIWQAPFTSCNNLQNVGGFINLGMQPGVEGFSLADSPLLTADSVTNIINNLYDRATAGFNPATLTFNNATMDKFTDELYATATAKGWNVSFN